MLLKQHLPIFQVLDHNEDAISLNFPRYIAILSEIESSPQNKSNTRTWGAVTMETKHERLPLLTTERENLRHEITGLLLMVLAALCFGSLGVLVRYLTAYCGEALSTVVLVRGLTQTALTLLATILVPNGHKTFENTKQLWVALALRGGSGALATVALVGSYKLLDFSIASSIFYTSKSHTAASLHSPLTRPRPGACTSVRQRRSARADKT